MLLFSYVNLLKKYYLPVCNEQYMQGQVNVHLLYHYQLSMEKLCLMNFLYCLSEEIFKSHKVKF